jgi:hypothetical protein
MLDKFKNKSDGLLTRLKIKIQLWLSRTYLPERREYFETYPHEK